MIARFKITKLALSLILPDSAASVSLSLVLNGDNDDAVKFQHV